LYYDDPNSTEEEKTRWAVGIVEADIGEDAKEALTKAGYKRFVVEACNTVKSKWVFLPQLALLSILCMVWRCYPAMVKYCVANKVVTQK